MPLILTTDTNPGQASWSDAADLGLGYEIVQQRIQLADLPAAAGTNTQVFGVVPANRPVLGILFRLNTDVDVGASGITNVKIASGVGSTTVPLTDNAQYSADLELVGLTDSPRYINAVNESTDILPGLSALATDGTGFYGITATGGNLNTLVAFDITVILVLGAVTISVP